MYNRISILLYKLKILEVYRLIVEYAMEVLLPYLDEKV